MKKLFTLLIFMSALLLNTTAVNANVDACEIDVVQLDVEDNSVEQMATTAEENTAEISAELKIDYAMAYNVDAFYNECLSKQTVEGINRYSLNRFHVRLYSTTKLNLKRGSTPPHFLYYKRAVVSFS